MDLDLTGRVAVVTGGSKGIGLAVTEALLAEGAHVAVASRTRSPELDELEHLPGDLLHVPADLADAGAPAEVVARTVEELGGIDILVNNAGGPPPGAKLPRFGFLDLGDDDWREMLEFNLLSAVRACRVAIPLILERGGGAIVNVTSVHARQPSAVNVDYGAAKAAMTNLTKALAEEFGPQGVRANCVCPGPVRTPWWTDEGGAADILAGADRHRSRERDGDAGAGDDAAHDRASRRAARDRRRGRAARLVPVGEHERRRVRRRRRHAEGGMRSGSRTADEPATEACLAVERPAASDGGRVPVAPERPADGRRPERAVGRERDLVDGERPEAGVAASRLGAHRDPRPARSGAP